MELQDLNDYRNVGLHYYSRIDLDLGIELNTRHE